MGHKEEVFGPRRIENDPGFAWKNGAVPLLWRVIDGSAPMRTRPVAAYPQNLWISL